MLAHKRGVPTPELADPSSPIWRRVGGEVVKLVPVPLGLQPSPYIVASRGDIPFGRVPLLRAKSIHNGQEIGFHIEWEDATRNAGLSDTDSFPDGAALLFPLKGDAPLLSMGAESQPVNAWHWRADRPDRALNNVATGLGTTRVTGDQSISTHAAWEHGRWQLVFTRRLRVDAPGDESIQLAPGEEVRVAFAVWEGANGERAGLKAFSPDWHPLRLGT